METVHLLRREVCGIRCRAIRTIRRSLAGVPLRLGAFKQALHLRLRPRRTRGASCFCSLARCQRTRLCETGLSFVRCCDEWLRKDPGFFKRKFQTGTSAGRGDSVLVGLSDGNSASLADGSIAATHFFLPCVFFLKFNRRVTFCVGVPGICARSLDEHFSWLPTIIVKDCAFINWKIRFKVLSVFSNCRDNLLIL